ncbi:hypothetical protein GGX14DRAFT_671844 [Mycena pura]|uniref:F-box domain-containing protein n=1 Tax=Mycena pura TaxID=153505 RepID=A0AAD6V0K7_9AGAR|nr:hypothetical protein GGX14DRAFT_671844 [Mycena pura]
MDLLFSESRRWQTLDLLDTRVSNNMKKHLIPSRARFPLLEKLTLVMIVEPLHKDTALLFESLPALVDLTLQVNVMPIPSTLDFVWAQLRACRLNGCLTTDILRILPHFSAGARICFENCFERIQDAHHLNSVHTVISDLSLHFSTFGAAKLLLGAIIAPCLKKLYISGTIYIPYISAFYDRSSFTLTHLRLSRHRGVNDLDDVIRSPLAVDIIDFDYDLECFSRPMSDSDKAASTLASRDILPNVRTLVLRNCERLHDATVLAIHANRRPVLQSLWLQGPTTLSQDTIQALKTGGLEVVMF